MSEELKPCPFCDRTDALKVVSASEFWDEENEGPYPHSDSWAVVCDATHPGGPGGCGAQAGFRPNKEGAIAAWNTRIEP